jgi:hypothetical protein
MGTVIIITAMFSLITTAANALVLCAHMDPDSIMRKGLGLYCLPDAVQNQHDAECVALGLERETDAYFMCRVFMGDAYRNSQVLKKLQGKAAEDMAQR